MGSFLGHIVSGTLLSMIGLLFVYLSILQFVKEQKQKTDKKGLNEESTSLSASRADDMTEMRNDFFTRIAYGHPKIMLFGVFGGLFLIFFIEMPGHHTLLPMPYITPAHGFSHQFLYGGYTLSALAVYLEKKRYLPYTSCTWMLAVANWISYILWSAHANMQEGAHAIFHVFAANACFIGCLFYVLLAFLQIGRQRDILHVPVVASFYMMLLQGMIMFTIAFWIFDFRTPFKPDVIMIPEWQPPCLVAACVFTSLAGMAAVWNLVHYTQGKRNNNHSDDGEGSHDSDETLPLSTDHLVD